MINVAIEYIGTGECVSKFTALRYGIKRPWRSGQCPIYENL